MLTNLSKKGSIKFSKTFALVSIAVLLTYSSVLQAIEQVYIANQPNESVSIVTTSNNNLTLNTNFGGNLDFKTGVVLSPQAIAFTADGSKVYIVNSLSLNGIKAVTVVNAATNTLITSINLTGISSYATPQSIAIAPNGHAYISISAYNSGAVAVIDTKTDTFLKIINLNAGTESYPWGVAVNSKGLVYITNNISSGSINVIDSSTDSEIAGSPFSLGSGESPTAIAINSLDQAYIVNSATVSGNGNITAFDTTNNTLTGQLPLKTTYLLYDIAINSNDIAYITNASTSSNTLNVLNTTTNTEITNSPFTLPSSSSQVGSVAISPTTGDVYVADTTNNQVYVLETSKTGVPFQITGSPFSQASFALDGPFAMAITPAPLPPPTPTPTPAPTPAPTPSPSAVDLINAVNKYTPLQIQKGTGGL